MSAYVVLDAVITDPELYARYRELAAPTLGAFGGRFLARGGAAERLEGERTPGRIVILEFPSLERARAWWSSPAYAAARELRQRASTGSMLVVEGC